MPTASPALASVLIGLVTAGVTVLGYLLAQRGKKGDQAQEAIKSQFDRMLGENQYLSKELKDTRNEWEARWDRQMARCRKVTDAASATISDLMRFVPPDRQHKGTHAIDEIAAHVEDDHPEP